MKTTLTLARATEHDLPTVLGLINDAARWLSGKGTRQWQSPWPNLEERDQRVSDGIEAGKTWILWDGDRHRKIAAATVTVDHEGDPKLWQPTELADRTVYVQRLVVNRAYAGKRLGEGLMDWAGRYGRREWGARLIRIDVWTDNFALRAYYEATGFQLVRTCEESYPEYPAGALMQKPASRRLDDVRLPFQELSGQFPQLSLQPLGSRWQKPSDMPWPRVWLQQQPGGTREEVVKTSQEDT